MLVIDHKDVLIPKLGFGTWQLEGQDCVAAVQKALEVGYRHVDTAQIYENEEYVGEAIKHSNMQREDVFLTTKIWRDSLKSDDFERSFEESLKKLQTSYVDMLLIHWPVEDVPFESQMESLTKIKEQGRARLIGVSNFNSTQLKHCVETLGADLSTNQVEYHPSINQDPMKDALKNYNMFLTAYSPLGRGKAMDAPLIAELAQKYSKSKGLIVLRWHMQNASVVAIPKASSEEHIRDNFNIFDFEIDQDDMQKIDALKKNHDRLIDPDFAPKWDKVA